MKRSSCTARSATGFPRKRNSPSRDQSLHPVPSLSPQPKNSPNRPDTKRRALSNFQIRANPAPEALNDLLFLLAAMVIIALIHHYIPNSGKAPHSIVEVVNGSRMVPG